MQESVRTGEGGISFPRTVLTAAHPIDDEEAVAPGDADRVFRWASRARSTLEWVEDMSVGGEACSSEAARDNAETRFTTWYQCEDRQRSVFWRFVALPAVVDGFVLLLTPSEHFTVISSRHCMAISTAAPDGPSAWSVACDAIQELLWFSKARHALEASRPSGSSRIPFPMLPVVGPKGHVLKRSIPSRAFTAWSGSSVERWGDPLQSTPDEYLGILSSAVFVGDPGAEWPLPESLASRAIQSAAERCASLGECATFESAIASYWIPPPKK
ncbi:MAG: hypothetical protein R3B07_15135 [Polyangiaceae bacterium]